jgi:hypothetical protein
MIGLVRLALRRPYTSAIAAMLINRYLEELGIEV